MYKSIKELFTAIADVIRERLGIEGKIPTQDMPQRVLDLFFTGFNNGRETGETLGYNQGLTEGIKQGKQAQSDESWDMFTNNGKRTDFIYAFNRWSKEYIRPNRKIIPTEVNSGSNTFSVNHILKKVEAQYFDFSQKPRGNSNTSGWYYTFISCLALEEIEDIGLGAQKGYYGTFSGCQKLHTIAKIGFDENTIMDAETFGYCRELQNLTIEGVIGQNGFDVKWSKKLSKASIISIMTHLSDTASGKSITISKTAVNNGFETSAGAADGSTSEEWVTLITAKSNWTINLIDA